MRRHLLPLTALLFALLSMAWEAKALIAPVGYGVAIVHDTDHVAATPLCWNEALKQVRDTDDQSAALNRCQSTLQQAADSLLPHAIGFTVSLICLWLFFALKKAHPALP